MTERDAAGETREAAGVVSADRLVDRMPAIVWSVDGELRFTALRGGALRSVGLDADALIGRTLFERFGTTDESFVPIAAARRALAGESARYEIELAGRVFESQVDPLTDADGRIVGAVGLSVDITARRQAEDALVEAAREKDVLLKEVNHRVKNSLQLVSSLLTLQALSNKDPDVRAQFQEACGRIGTVAQVHQRLYMSDRFRMVAVADYLRDLCGELSTSLATAAGGRSILVDADEADLPADSLIPLALIVNELVTNAMKYAYGPGEPGDVLVSFQVLPDGAKRLTIADRGRGLPADFDMARANSLGMKVVKAFAGQLRGSLRAESPGVGTRFVLDLPA
ncbi:sensor histidine kinase [Azospirillum sp. A39]|uniref:sensor histidine kinase n=1 Tax=Azospirillum sp. A39 TaxID=3462279 RepID=UPI004046828C